MSLLEIEGRRYAFGLQWAFVSDRPELARLLRRVGAHAVVDHPTDDGLLYGLPATDTDARPLVGASAAALLVGRLVPDAIVHHPLPDGRVWICAVRDGLPLPGSDRLCTQAESVQAVHDILMYQPELPRIGSLPGSSHTLAELLARADTRLWRQTTLRSARRGARLWLVAGTLLCLGVLAMLYWQHLERERQQRRAQTALSASRGAAPDLKALQAAYDEEVRQAVEQARAAMLRQPPFEASATQWVRAVRALPLSVGGYRPRQLDCRPVACTTEWDWNAEFFDASALTRLPGERITAATPTEYATRAQTRLTLDVPGPSDYQPLTGEALGDALLALSSAVQRHGARISISAPDQPIVAQLPAPPAALQGDNKANRPAAPRTRIIGQQGRVRLMVSGWHQAQSLLNVLGRYPLIPERALVSINQSSVGMQIEARYIVPQEPQ